MGTFSFIDQIGGNCEILRIFILSKLMKNHLKMHVSFYFRKMNIQLIQKQKEATCFEPEKNAKGHPLLSKIFDSIYKLVLFYDNVIQVYKFKRLVSIEIHRARESQSDFVT